MDAVRDSLQAGDDREHEAAAKLFRGLSDAGRLALLRALRDGPTTAGALATAAGLSPSGASNHLRCLLECGLVTVELAGRNSIYRLADPSIARLLEAGDGVLALVGPLIEACRNYGPPRRRQPAQGRSEPLSQRAG